MGNLLITYLPPQNWQDFEKMLKGIVDVIWPQEGWQNYGRAGQNQSGIDLYGYDAQKRFTAIQCKKKDPIDSEGKLLTNSLLTEKLINDEITAAENIENPSLEKLIFATTSSRDTKVQDIVRAINETRRKQGKFQVDIWFWEDIQIHFEKHIELRYWYFQELLEDIHKYDQDIHVLTMLRQAFTRPAFNRAIHREESGADFIQAVRDTMEAITTGKLYNRRGELITTSLDYTQLSNTNWKNELKRINDQLDKIRDIYQDGLLKQQIREHPTCLEILDDNISDQFNTLRADCLNRLNKILKEKNLELVESELLKTGI